MIMEFTRAAIRGTHTTPYYARDISTLDLQIQICVHTQLYTATDYIITITYNGIEDDHHELWCGVWKANLPDLHSHQHSQRVVSTRVGNLVVVTDDNLACVRMGRPKPLSPRMIISTSKLALFDLKQQKIVYSLFHHRARKISATRKRSAHDDDRRMQRRDEPNIRNDKEVNQDARPLKLSVLI